MDSWELPSLSDSELAHRVQHRTGASFEDAMTLVRNWRRGDLKATKIWSNIFK